MKLGICCNFGPPSIGGSEYVIKNISDRLVKDFGYEVNIYTFSENHSFRLGNLNIIPCQKGDKFISQIAQNDHLMVYSDSFWEFDTLVENIEKIDCRASVALVGAYHMQSHPKTFELLKKKINKFNLIVHSRITPDYNWCLGTGKDSDRLPVKIIPNGVDLSEFRDNSLNFREKYNIKEKYIILNVSNFFYGKGQEALPKIY